jgi:hypothetical protein
LGRVFVLPGRTPAASICIFFPEAPSPKPSLGHFWPAILIESGMSGYVHIFRLGMREGTYGKIVGEYQFTYSASGKSWVRTFDDEASLLEFLRSDVAIPEDVAESALGELRRTGKTTIADVEIRESEAPAMGLEQLPSET